MTSISRMAYDEYRLTTRGHVETGGHHISGSGLPLLPEMEQVGQEDWWSKVTVTISGRNERTMENPKLRRPKGRFHVE